MSNLQRFKYEFDSIQTMGVEEAGELKLLRVPTEPAWVAPNPIAEPKRTTHMWNVGELGLGTKPAGRDHAIALAELYEIRKAERSVPDVIVLHGEVMALIPPYVSKGGLDLARVLEKSIDTLDDSIVTSKPDVTRLTDLARENGTRIIYVMGISDNQNAKNLHQIISKTYLYSPRTLVEMRASYRDQVRQISESIESTESDQANRKKAIEKAREELEKEVKYKGKKNDAATKLRQRIASYTRESAKAEDKLWELRDAHKDYSKILDMYSELVKAWIFKNRGPYEEDFEKAFEIVLEKLYGKRSTSLKTFYPDIDPDLEELFMQTRGREERTAQLAKIRSDMEKEDRKMKEFDPVKDKALIDASVERKKTLFNLEKKLASDITSEVREEAQSEDTKRNERGYRFTRQVYTQPKIGILSNNIAQATILANLRDVFGRRMPIEIVEKNIGTISVNGLKVKVTNKPSNASAAYVKKPLRALEGMLKDGEEIDFVLASRTPWAIAKPVPLHDQSPKKVWLIASPSMFDPKGFWDAWNSGIKTTFTELASKGTPTFGFHEITNDGVTTLVDFHTTNELKALADRVKIREIDLLVKMIGNAQVNGNGEQNGLEGKDRLRLFHKLPSEISASPDTRNLFTRLLSYLDIDPANVELRQRLADRVRQMAFGGEVTRAAVWEQEKLASSTTGLVADEIKDPKKAGLTKAEIAEKVAQLEKRPDPPELAKALEWFRSYIQPEETDRTKLINMFKILGITDYHIGSEAKGEPTLTLLKGEVRYIVDRLDRENAPPVFFMSNGDNGEGPGLRNHMYERYRQALARNYDEFLKWIEKEKSMDPQSDASLNIANEYGARLYLKSPIHGRDEQYQRFVDNIEAIAKHEKVQGGAFWDGNHDRTLERQDSEAASIADRLIPRLPEDRRGTWKVFSQASDQGSSGYMRIARGPLIEGAHEGNAETAIEKRRSKAMVYAVGHSHEFQAIVVGEQFVVTGPPGQAPTNFATSGGWAASEEMRGISEYTVTYDDKNRPLVFGASAVFQGDLKKLSDSKGVPYLRPPHPLIQEFEASFSRLNFDAAGIRALRRVELGKTVQRSIA
jgi:hypothetical protein